MVFIAPNATPEWGPILNGAILGFVLGGVFILVLVGVYWLPANRRREEYRRSRDKAPL